MRPKQCSRASPRHARRSRKPHTAARPALPRFPRRTTRNALLFRKTATPHSSASSQIPEPAPARHVSRPASHFAITRSAPRRAAHIAGDGTRIHAGTQAASHVTRENINAGLQRCKENRASREHGTAGTRRQETTKRGNVSPSPSRHRRRSVEALFEVQRPRDIDAESAPQGQQCRKPQHAEQ